MNLAGTLLRLGRRLRAAAADTHYARTRMLALTLSCDRYLPDPDAAPAHYAEFLLRAGAPLRHEPGARERLRATASR